jgi:hypothetical protein
LLMYKSRLLMLIPRERLYLIRRALDRLGKEIFCGVSSRC